MSIRSERPPVVPLQSAAGPEHPPCPACSNPLFPGLAEPWREAETVLRCEVCGLAIAGGIPGDPEAARAAAADAGDGTPNRAGFAAWIGRGAWAGLEPGEHYLLTPDALTRLRPRDSDPLRPAISIPLMWQTLQNSFTFGRNLALARRLEATPAPESWQRALDWVIVVATALPLLLVAAVLEVVAGLAGRGGVLRHR